MTTREIEGLVKGKGVQVRECWFWLSEIAYQLALINEREQAKLPTHGTWKPGQISGGTTV